MPLLAIFSNLWWAVAASQTCYRCCLGGRSTMPAVRFSSRHSRAQAHLHCDYARPRLDSGGFAAFGIHRRP